MGKPIAPLMPVDCFVSFAFGSSFSFFLFVSSKDVAGKWKSESSILHSAESGGAVSMQHQKTFNRMLKRFREGTLRNDDAKQSRASPYEDVKEKLLKYVELRAQLYKHDKCGLSWALLKQKALFYAKQLGHDLNSFKAGVYFISSVLKKGNKKCVALTW
jgi:hypothetical protein